MERLKASPSESVHQAEYVRGMIPKPLNWLPLRSEWIEEVDDFHLGISAHEYNHLKTGRRINKPPVLTVIRPSGLTLGYAIFYGLTPYQEETIAAGGMEPTLFGQAEGYGGDMRAIYRSNLRRHNYDIYEASRTSDLAISSARNEVRRYLGPDPYYSREVEERVIEYMAYIKEIPGWMIEPLYQRAKWEIEFERAVGEERNRLYELLQNQIVFVSPEEVELVEKAKEIGIDGPIPEHFTVIDTRFRDQSQELKLCQICKQMTGPNMPCPHYCERKTLDIEGEIPQVANGFNSGRRRDRISQPRSNRGQDGVEREEMQVPVAQWTERRFPEPKVGSSNLLRNAGVRRESPKIDYTL